MSSIRAGARFSTSLVVAALVQACGGAPLAPDRLEQAGGRVSPGGGPLVFTVPPVDPAVVDFILPLGNLNPPSHTLPTDHIYFYMGFLRPSPGAVPVVSPGGGTVAAIFRGSPDSKIFVRASATHQWYLDHVVLNGDIREGVTLTPGQALGTTGRGFGLDLGVLNQSRALGFLNPARYSGDTLYADAPLRYFEEPVRGQLYAMVRREGEGLDGRIDYDEAGRLTGNWFFEGLPASRSTDVSAGASQLAFVYDNVRPAEAVVSTGGVLGPIGVFVVESGSPAWRDVTPERGPVVFRLSQSGGTLGIRSPQVVGSLLVEMLATDRLRAEFVAGAGQVSGGFTGAARVFVR